MKKAPTQKNQLKKILKIKSFWLPEAAGMTKKCVFGA
jgi:hypothetical protein